MKKQIIKPCPFCGSDPALDRQGSYWYIRCQKMICDVRPSSHLHPAKYLAIQAWNKRKEVKE